ncbi:MAG: UDP-N-acetylglucosamine 2-epimerase (non-hydrolyzing) [Dehalococcoidales bacterium]|nr:UDP-N-acetylglucosamine 2-epimerase (non-hydrolyzing) [Dehalococcoidales bacterium]
MKIAIIVGTRPEIIKLSPVIRELEKCKDDYFIIHTGQHYSYYMDRVFFEQLKIATAKYNLEVGSGSHAEQTAKILVGVEKILSEEKPDIILVQGDTNTVFASAIAAVKLHIRVGHVEAGLRSYDRRMPEEINRVLTDHCSDYLFAPTKQGMDNLISEGIPKDRISITGNTIVDAVYQNLEIADSAGDSLKALNLTPESYFLVTLHRQENVDDHLRFARILEALDSLYSAFQFPVIYPVHPRSRNIMDKFNLKPQRVAVVEPLDFFGFLQLEKNARLILTDSGGVQEEACILGTPCVTIRDNTERPETLEVGANILAGTMPDSILKCAETMLQKKNSWSNPFGDGSAGKMIVRIIRETLN